MSGDKPDLYAGLDQMIAKPTKPAAAEPAPPEPVQPEAPEPAAEATTSAIHKAASGHPAADETHLVRQLEPDLPDEPYLYRKQTLDFGPKDLEAVEKMQRVMSGTHKRQITKTDIVRAAVEFLSKDCDAHAEQSYLVRKFVRR
jgi:hypothetical protein